MRRGPMYSLTRVAVLAGAIAILGATASCGARGDKAPVPSVARSAKFVQVASPIAGQYVVLLEPSVRAEDVQAIAAQLTGRYGGSVARVYGTAVRGFSARLG